MDCIGDEAPVGQLTLEMSSPLCSHAEVLFGGVRVFDEVAEGVAIGTAVQKTGDRLAPGLGGRRWWADIALYVTFENSVDEFCFFAVCWCRRVV